MINTISMIVAGLGIIMLGYLIWVKKMLQLIIGYNEATFYGDKDKYAKRMGLLAISLGVLVLSMPFAIMLFGDIVNQIYQILAMILVILIIVVANYWRFRF